MKILIVDDIETNRKLLRVNLESEGMESCEASDGIEAMDSLEREPVRPDAIISDILMPRMDGYRLCREVRKHPVYGSIPFIFYTSTYISPSDERLARSCGADEYIKKPSPIRVLLEAVHRFSHQQRQRQATVESLDESIVMREYNEVLVHKLEERNEKLERARSEIARANAELELRVAARTADLLSANQELEAFSHSIAHDLRSPLTAIYGFSDLLIQECQGKVSERAIRELHYISDAAGRMNELTSDLLRLARANRAEVCLRTVDLSALATEILREMQTREPDRDVTCMVALRLTAQADPGLMRIALENLLGNAWKYTGRTPQARIEFGIEEQLGQRVYFVRDNGAGFDMDLAGKIFHTFVRLHLTSDFPGTGIGLSTVQRIITRHGGRIWAEAAVERGATFYFTLEAPSRGGLPEGAPRT